MAAAARPFANVYVDQLIHQLQANNRYHSTQLIELPDFQNQNQVDRLAQAIHTNEFVERFTFQFGSLVGQGNSTLPLSLNWSPLLRELETRGKLRWVGIVLDVHPYFPPSWNRYGRPFGYLISPSILSSASAQ